jgi:hypothetical protein
MNICAYRLYNKEKLMIGSARQNSNKIRPPRRVCTVEAGKVGAAPRRLCAADESKVQHRASTTSVVRLYRRGGSKKLLPPYNANPPNYAAVRAAECTSATAAGAGTFKVKPIYLWHAVYV